MIRDLDETLRKLLQTKASAGSELAGAEITFDLPDATWRASLEKLTVNGYLYDIRENLSLRTAQPLLERSPDQTQVRRRTAPVRLDCAYCITAWSPAPTESVLDEHRLLSQVLVVLLKNPTIPGNILQGSLVGQIPPYPTVVAAPDGVKNQPEFWGALDQKLKPSLNYVITLAIRMDEPPPAMGPPVKQVVVKAENKEDFPA